MRPIWADFNDIEDDDYVVVDLDSSHVADEKNNFHEGMTVELSDGVHECLGEIVAIDVDNWLARVKLDWDTWHSVISSIAMESDVNSIVFEQGYLEHYPPMKIEQSAQDPVTISP
jgi:hypothetical protein